MGKPASLLFFDLNDFKAINDTFGHAEGDRALATFAELMRDSLRDSDVIGRLGGDEFVALLTDSGHFDTTEVIRRLRQGLDQRNKEAQRGYDIRCSVGQVEYDLERHSVIADLLAEADAAMYADKQATKALSA
jgi:diguanylate cyclase (GGDEF)-like protein